MKRFQSGQQQKIPLATGHLETGVIRYKWKHIGIGLTSVRLQGGIVSLEKKGGVKGVGTTVTPDREHYCCHNKSTSTTSSQLQRLDL